MSSSESSEVKPASIIAAVATYVSAALAAGLTVCHWFQFDSLAAVTLVPTWAWIVPASFLLAIAFRKITRHQLFAIVFAWAVFFGLFSEEIRSLARLRKLDDRKQAASTRPATTAASSADTIRVITLNCNVGSPAAARETFSFSPDIVLLQETPGEQRLAELTVELSSENASYLRGGDGSILVRGQLTPIQNDASSHFTHAVATLRNGRQLGIVSLRLSAPVFRLDFWTLSFWEDHKHKRRHHRQQIQAVIDHLNKHHVTNTWIVGGDFNLPGGDGALSPFFGKLQDSFYQSGVGWGNTGTSDYPIFRVDQIWSTGNLKPLVSKAVATAHSDHRMVVVDFSPAP